MLTPVPTSSVITKQLKRVEPSKSNLNLRSGPFKFKHGSSLYRIIKSLKYNNSMIIMVKYNNIKFKNVLTYSHIASGVKNL